MNADTTMLRRSAAVIAAPGTDTDHLGRIVAWACGPRRDLGRLRRHLLEHGPGGVGPTTSSVLAELVGTPDAPLREVAMGVLERWARGGVRVALVGDPAYPARLAEGWPHLDAPVLLAWRGAPPADVGPSVAIVGSRNASEYGSGVAAWLATAVARAGGRVVSGGAVGVDAAAHTAAIGLPGGTTVVLGSGHDVRYPAAHARAGGLFERVLDDGGTLVSELLPEVQPHPGVIRARNRILAGLADVVVVVEGGVRSGSLLTAAAAADRGRPVLAVPGDIRAPGSAAPLRLLAEGAAPCAGPDDLLALLPQLARRDPVGVGEVAPSATGLLPAELHAMLASAWPRTLTLDECARSVQGDAVGSVLALLTRARLAGVVEDTGQGLRLAHAPRPSGR